MSIDKRGEKPQKIVIFGFGQGADIARRYFESDTRHQIVGYMVDRKYIASLVPNGNRVVAVDEAITAFPPDNVLAFVPLGSTGMNSLRAEKYALLKSLGYRFISFVHSSNQIAGRCEIGENCFILENQSINFDSIVGNNVVIWSGCQIGDRSRIGDHVFMAAHVVLNGDVRVGASAYLGSNCNISNGVRIAPQSFIGANALICQDTKERSVHVVPPTPSAGIDSLRFVRMIRARALEQ